MAVDLPLCQALVQTNFPGREPVMTGLINLKRESKLTLEQKGNQGRVKILLWLQESKRELKKKKRKEKREKKRQTIHLPLSSSSCCFLHAPSRAWGPRELQRGGARTGIWDPQPRFQKCFGMVGSKPLPRHLQNSALHAPTALNPSAGQTLAQSCAMPRAAAGTGQSPCSWQPLPLLLLSSPLTCLCISMFSP